MDDLQRWITATRVREYTALAALFLVLALLATWPLVTAPATHSVSDRANNDVFLNQYLIFWGAHALFEEPGNLYDTNMFYPAHYGFAYADMLLTDSIVLYPVIRAFYDPTLTYNVLLWLAMVVGGTGMYALCRLLVGSRLAALVAAVLFVANPTHFVRYRQPQFFNDGFLPWFLAAVVVWLASCGLWRRIGRRPGGAMFEPAGSLRHSLGWAAAAALVFCLHAQTGSHNAVFGAMLGVAFVATYAAPLLTRRGRTAAPAGATRRFLAGAGLMATIGVLVLGPAFYPYAQVSEHLQSQRIGAEEAAARQLGGGSAGIVELLTTSSHFYRWLDDTVGWPSRFFGHGDRGARADLFPGLVLPLLALLALLPAGLRAGPLGRRLAAALLDVVMVVAVVAAVATLTFGWRRLGPGVAPVPTVWIWPAVAALALGARWRWLRTEPHALVVAGRALPADRDLRFWFLAALVCFLVALGPAFGVYEVLRWIPAASLIRVPSRFVLPMVMAMSVMAAWGVRRLLASAPQRGHAVLAVAALLFAAEASFAPLPTAANPYPPDPAAVWLGRQPGEFAVLEIPVDTGATPATRQMLQSIHHWKKLLIGYSGSAPPGYEERMQSIADGFPSAAVLDDLVALRVRYLVVLESRAGPQLLARMTASPRLRRVQRFAESTIWELR